MRFGYSPRAVSLSSSGAKADRTSSTSTNNTGITLGYVYTVENTVASQNHSSRSPTASLQLGQRKCCSGMVLPAVSRWLRPPAEAQQRVAAAAAHLTAPRPPAPAAPSSCRHRPGRHYAALYWRGARRPPVPNTVVSDMSKSLSSCVTCMSAARVISNAGLMADTDIHSALTS